MFTYNRNLLHTNTYNPEPTPVSAPGIYWNSSLGAISVSSNLTEWVTIADKNLGATQVYEQGDTISQTNCGGTFQRGNNYMFPLMGTIPNRIYGQTNAANYGPYYYNDTFLTAIHNINRGNRCEPSQDNLWGRVTNTNIAKQGPCPDGYHIPSSDDFNNMLQILGNLGQNNPYILKMPFAGRRDMRTGNTDSQGGLCYYWCSSCSSPFSESFGTNGVTWSGGRTNRAQGYSIRAFKNNPVIPSDLSSWVVLYDGGGGTGIFWNEALGVISMSDGGDFITIADKNLGATQVYNYGDELTEANCGKYYQWGNNYGFSRQGEIKIGGGTVAATNYGPYYYSDTFRCTYTTSSYHLDTWDSTDNRNLWGFVTGTNKAMKGPCNEGFHIPSVANWGSLIAQLVSLGIIISEDYFDRAFEYLKIGRTTVRYIDGTYDSPDSSYYTAFWCANRANYMAEYGMRGGDYGETYYGMPIRPFSNTSIIPDDSWTKLY